MVNWVDELKRHISNHFNEMMDSKLSPNNIKIYNVDIKVDNNFLKLLSINELATIYSYSIMLENFEQANQMKKILAERNCKVDFNIDEKTKTGVLDIIFKPEKTIQHVKINMIITPDGCMVDFNKE